MMWAFDTSLIEFSGLSRLSISFTGAAGLSRLFRERRVTLVCENHFVPMVNSIRIQVVRVEDSQVDVFSVRPFLCNPLQREASGEFRDAHCLLSSP
jgi:hypothetical protein